MIDLDSEFGLHALQCNFELEPADASEDRHRITTAVLGEHVDHAFLGKLRERPVELLVLLRIGVADLYEVLRRQGGQGRITDRLAHEDGVADLKVGRVDHADDVPGEGLLEGLPLPPEAPGGVVQGQRLAGAGVGHLHAAGELTRADPDEGVAVAVAGVHVRLDLEDQAGEVILDLAQLPVFAGAGIGRRREFDDRVEQQLYTEVGQGRTEEDRG